MPSLESHTIGMFAVSFLTEEHLYDLVPLLFVSGCPHSSIWSVFLLVKRTHHTPVLLLVVYLSQVLVVGFLCEGGVFL